MGWRYLIDRLSVCVLPRRWQRGKQRAEKYTHHPTQATSFLHLCCSSCRQYPS